MTDEGRMASRAARRRSEARRRAATLATTALAMAASYRAGRRSKISAYLLSMAAGLAVGVYAMVALERRGEDRRTGRR